MNDAVFLDSNIWIYAAMGKYAEPRKYDIAREIVATRSIVLSAQVMGEFYKNVRNPRDMRKPLSFEEAMEWIDSFQELPLVETDRALVQDAILLTERYKIKYWDGAVLAAANRHGVTTLFSEDLNHGQLYGLVRVENPFLTH
jgi:predicted nucleic acid-binding protein